jgi:hypothetical protein
MRRRSGSATTSAPVESGPQSHFWPEMVRKSRPAASTGIAPRIGRRRPAPARPSARAARAPGARARSSRAPARARAGASSRHGGENGLGIGVDCDDARAAHVHRPEQPEVLLRRGHDLVLRLQVEASEDDVAAVRGRAGERDLLRLGADEAGQRDAGLLAEVEHPLEVLLARSVPRRDRHRAAPARRRPSGARAGRRCRAFR